MFFTGHKGRHELDFVLIIRTEVSIINTGKNFQQLRYDISEGSWDLIPSRDHHIRNGSETRPPFNLMTNGALFQEYI
jgi:hypothetical protein